MLTRREFLKASSALTAGVWAGAWTSRTRGQIADKNSRPVLGMIGCGGKGRDLSRLASAFGDFAAVCDVDRSRAETYANNPELNGNGVRKIDIAQWGIDAINTGPVEIEGQGVMDRRKDCYNTPQTFTCTLTFANGNRIIVKDGPDNGIMFEGEQEHIFVNRGRLSGNLIQQIRRDRSVLDRVRRAATALYDGPYGLPDGEIKDYEKFEAGSDWMDVKRSHMGNFFNCAQQNRLPMSDVATVQRSTTTCHLCNLAMRTGRKLTWDPEAEDFVGDAEASGMLAREQRKPYTIEA